MILDLKKCIKSNENLNNGECYDGVSCKELFKKFDILQISRKCLLSLLPFIVNNKETFQTQFYYSQQKKIRKQDPHKPNVSTTGYWPTGMNLNHMHL